MILHKALHGKMPKFWWIHLPVVAKPNMRSPSNNISSKNLGKDLGAAAVVIFSHNEEPVAMSCAAPVSEWQKKGGRPYFNLNLHVSVAFVLNNSSILYLKTNLLHSGRVQIHTAKRVTWHVHSCPVKTCVSLNAWLRILVKRPSRFRW